MIVITDKELADFIENKPLYYKYKVVENYNGHDNSYTHPSDFSNKSFKFLCPAENDIQTFKLNTQGDTYFGRFAHFDPNRLPMFFEKETGMLNITVPLIGVCQSCNKEISFLINISSSQPWHKRDSGIDIYIQKVGQYPGFDISLDKDLEQYLTTDDKLYYKKALISLSNGYGVGAYGYMRRVLENELVRIVVDISQLDFEGVHKIKDAYSKFATDHVMGNLINAISPYLPKSLLDGDNPIKLLYEQLSSGIHSLSENQCIERAISIDIIFKHVVKKVNEEKYQINSFKDAMKKLRTNNLD